MSGNDGSAPNVSIEDAIAKAKAIAAKFLLKPSGEGSGESNSLKREAPDDDDRQPAKRQRHGGPTEPANDVRPGIDYTPLPSLGGPAPEPVKQEYGQQFYEQQSFGAPLAHQGASPAASRGPVYNYGSQPAGGALSASAAGQPHAVMRPPQPASAGAAAPWANEFNNRMSSPPRYQLETLTLSIPSARVGLVIGKRGASINELQDRSGAKITVQPDHMSDRMARDRPVTIQGPNDACEKARQLIMEIVESGGTGTHTGPPMGHSAGPQDVGGITETMKVPHESAGYIIGKGGEMIKAISKTTNVHIQVDPPIVAGQTQRSVHMTGSREGIELAKQMIFERMKSKGKTTNTVDYSAFQIATPAAPSGYGFPSAPAGSAGAPATATPGGGASAPSSAIPAGITSGAPSGGTPVSAMSPSMGESAVLAGGANFPQNPQEAAAQAAAHWYRLYGYYYPPEYLAQYYAAFFQPGLVTDASGAMVPGTVPIAGARGMQVPGGSHGGQLGQGIPVKEESAGEGKAIAA